MAIEETIETVSANFRDGVKGAGESLGKGVSDGGSHVANGLAILSGAVVDGATKLAAAKVAQPNVNPLATLLFQQGAEAWSKRQAQRQD